MSFCSWWTYQRKKFCSRFFLTRSNGKSVRLGGRDWPKDEGSRVLSVSTSRKESIRFVICLLWGFLFYVFRNFLSEVPDLFDGLLVLIFLSWGSVSRREPFSFLREDQENMKTRSFCEDQDSYETTEKEGDLCLWTVLARYLCGSRSFYQDYSVRGLKLSWGNCVVKLRILNKSLNVWEESHSRLVKGEGNQSFNCDSL